MENLPKELKTQLKTDYYEKLAELDYDLTKLLDAVTTICDDYFSPTWEGKIISIT